MNDIQQAYCDGAAMAYRDCGKMMRNLIKNAPPEFRDTLSNLAPLADIITQKADEVYAETDRFAGGRQ